MPRKTEAERKQEAREYVNEIETLRSQDQSLSVDAACTKLGKSVNGYYTRKRLLEGKSGYGTKTSKKKVVKVGAKRRTYTRRVATTLPVAATAFREIPAEQRSFGGNGKMLLAVAVGDASEVNKTLDSVLSRFSRF